MEGKKCRALGQDCRAVSEVIGSVLMIAVVVLAFSSIAVFVFSDEGAVKPPHTPKVDLQESIDTDADTVQIFHKGGEAVDLEDAKIVLNINGKQEEFNLSSDRGVSHKVKNKNNVLMPGDEIVINTSLGRGKDLNSTDTVEMYFVHTESDQVIQKVSLLSGDDESETEDETEMGDDDGNGLPDWITPHPNGTAINEINVPADTEDVNESKDGQYIVIMPPKGSTGPKYAEFTFGIDASELGINEKFKANLRIDYWRHDSSSSDIIIELNDGNPNAWEQIETWDYNGKGGQGGSWVMDTKDVPLDGFVSSTAELENIKVRFVPSTNSGSENPNKALRIDFVGIHIEKL